MGALSRPAQLPRDALVAAGLVGSVNAVLWSVLVVAVRASWDTADRNTWGQLITLGVVNLVLGLALVAVCLLAGLPRRSLTAQIGLALLLSALFAAVRSLVDEAIMPLATSPPDEVGLIAIATVGCLVVASPAILVSTLVARRRAEQDARRAERARNRAATAALEADEAELRREVAEHLHGTVQNRLVVVGAGLDHLAAESDAEHRPERADALRAWARMIDTVRERDVRAISHQVFPTGLDLGLAQAVGLLLDRLPTSVSTSFGIGEGVREADQGIPLPDRLLVAATVEEGLTNALRHGRATRVDLRLDLAEGALRATLDDDGDGLPEAGVQESGLLRHRARIEARDGRIELAARESGGTRLTVELPLS